MISEDFDLLFKYNGLNVLTTLFILLLEKFISRYTFLDSCPTGAPIKSSLSVCLSLSQFVIFLQVISFSDFLHDDRYLEYLKTDKALKKDP